MDGQVSGNTIAIADRQLGWVDRLPTGWRDYALLARWDRPIGTWLLLLPCWWGITLPNDGMLWNDAPSAWSAPWPQLWLGALFAIGAVAMRGAGCTINDLADRDLDRRVARTRARPLAAGRLGARQALLFVGVQALVGLLVLVQLGQPAILIGLLSLPLIVIYPFMKRVTWWPQAFLGVTFNWGVLVGFAAVTGGVAPEAIVLYLAGIIWTLGYDTIYAHQDKVDDALIGIRSSALRLGAATKPWLWTFYAGMLALLGLAAVLADKSFGFWLLLPLVAWSLARQLVGLDLDDATDCLRRFRMNRLTGLTVTAALVAGCWHG